MRAYLLALKALHAETALCENKCTSIETDAFSVVIRVLPKEIWLDFMPPLKGRGSDYGGVVYVIDRKTLKIVHVMLGQ